ncbi:MAG TPA: pyridoxamine 5'-phosphate oxidase family protein [Anaeromyxobacter sp.]
MDEALRTKVLAYLAGHNVLTLSTFGPAGPWAAAVFYVNDGLRLYFLSSPRSRHAQDLAADPRTAAAIHEDYRDWPDIKGIQLEGRAAPVPEAEIDRVRALYGAKFPVVANAAKAPPEIAAALAGVRWYALTPEALHFIDNSAGFGQRRRLL